MFYLQWRQINHQVRMGLLVNSINQLGRLLAMTLLWQSSHFLGFLPKGINYTILALIPKRDEATKMVDYRPISCYNVVYKVLLKILANCLKKILPKFISTNQSAFVKDRLLMENVLLASELVKSYHKESVSARCAVKIDISKAFDTVQ